MLLTERSIDDRLGDTVPVGGYGVIPTNVTTENGPIYRDDLLVTSNTPGCAMKGTDRTRMPFAVNGRALANFDGPGIGKIEVLVNIK